MEPDQEVVLPNFSDEVLVLEYKGFSQFPVKTSSKKGTSTPSWELMNTKALLYQLEFQLKSFKTGQILTSYFICQLMELSLLGLMAEVTQDTRKGGWIGPFVIKQC
ncbi:hypothetical protein A2U01_0006340 [Trifolium medium]|uniref:Uncharacterized protein n=1 Tax=Trifolium medium TaxID=97028 RepID=A0A392MGX6_9FABA|nr:hypothetical protein [Trifolium medium]